jgi:hypothetical protein
MQFLKTLFWVIVAVVLVLFAAANWDTPQTESGKVIINLWGGLVAAIRLPVLVIGAFLVGFLPTFILYRARLWSMKRRLEGSAPVSVANVPASVTHPQPVPEGEARRNI